MVRRFLDWLFGYDFFISYGHGDGMIYPERLHDALSAGRPRFSVFLDKKQYTAGEDLDAATERRVRMSKQMIVVCGPKALSSRWVRREVEVFQAKGRKPIAIEINDTFQADPNAAWLRLVLGEALTIRETVTSPLEGPSAATIEQLVRSFTSWRVARVRLGVLSSVIIAFLGLALGIAGWYRIARLERELNQATVLADAALADLPRNPQRAIERAACSVQFASLPKGIVALTRVLSSTWGVERFLAGHDRPVRGAVFSLDGRELITNGSDRRVIVWDVETGAQHSSLTIGEEGNFSVALDRSGERILIGDRAGNLHIWRYRLPAGKGAVVSRKLHDGTVWAIVPVEGSLVATAGWDNTIRLYDLDSGRVRCEVPDAHGYTVNTRSRWVRTLAYESLSRRLFSGGSDGKIRSWDLSKPSGCLSAGPVAEHGGELESLAVSPGGRLLASGGQKGVKLWRIEGGGIEPIEADELGAEGLEESVGGLSFSAEGRLLAIGRWDGSTDLWDLGQRLGEDEGPMLVYRNSLHGGPVNRVCFAPVGGRLASVAQDDSVALWNLEEAQELARPVPLDYFGSAASALSPSASFAVSWRGGDSIVVQSLPRTVARRTLRSKEYEEAWNSQITIFHGISTAAVSGDGRYAALGYRNGPFQILEVGSGRMVLEDVTAHGDGVTAIEWSPAAPRRVLSGAEDGTVVLWSLGSSGWEKKPVHRHEGGVSALAFSEDGRLIGSASNLVAPIVEPVQVWEVEPLRRIDEIPIMDPEVGVTWALALDGANRRAARAVDSGEVLLRDLKNHVDLPSLIRPGGNLKSLSFDPGGQYLATGDAGGRIKVWRMADGQQTAELISGSVGPQGWIEDLRFLPSGKALASVNGGRAVVWTLDEARLLSYARRLATGSSSTELPCP